jgi:hypothetical protein
MGSQFSWRTAHVTGNFAGDGRTEPIIRLYETTDENNFEKPRRKPSQPSHTSVRPDEAHIRQKLKTK